MMEVQEFDILGPGPYGIRIKGGSDFNYPIVIIQVTPGGKADQAGVTKDLYVLSVNGIDFAKLTHAEAASIIKSASSLHLVLAESKQDHSSIILYKQQKNMMNIRPNPSPIHRPSINGQIQLPSVFNRNGVNNKSEWYKEFLHQINGDNKDGKQFLQNRQNLLNSETSEPQINNDHYLNKIDREFSGYSVVEPFKPSPAHVACNTYNSPNTISLNRSSTSQILYDTKLTTSKSSSHSFINGSKETFSITDPNNTSFERVSYQHYESTKFTPTPSTVIDRSSLIDNDLSNHKLQFRQDVTPINKSLNKSVCETFATLENPPAEIKNGGIKNLNFGAGPQLCSQDDHVSSTESDINVKIKCFQNKNYEPSITQRSSLKYVNIDQENQNGKYQQSKLKNELFLSGKQKEKQKKSENKNNLMLIVPKKSSQSSSSSSSFGPFMSIWSKLKMKYKNKAKDIQPQENDINVQEFSNVNGDKCEFEMPPIYCDCIVNDPENAQEPVFVKNSCSNQDKVVAATNLLFEDFHDLKMAPKFDANKLPCFGVVTHEFYAKSPNELCVRKNAIVHVLRQIDGSCVEVEHKGLIGQLPIEIIEVYEKDKTEDDKYDVIGIGNAIASFETDSKVILSYKKDDYVLINGIIDDNWYEATINNKRGIVKRSNIQLLEGTYKAGKTINGFLENNHTETSSSEHESSHNNGNNLFMFICEANQNFDPSCSDEISLDKGDVIGVKKYYSDGWGFGYNQRSFKSGMFPVFFTDIIINPG